MLPDRAWGAHVALRTREASPGLSSRQVLALPLSTMTLGKLLQLGNSISSSVKWAQRKHRLHMITVGVKC